MNLNKIPAPVWYVAAAAVAAALLYKKTTSVASTATTAALKFGDSLQTSSDGTWSLGTKIYDLFNGTPTFDLSGTKAINKNTGNTSSAGGTSWSGTFYDYGTGTPGVPYRTGVDYLDGGAPDIFNLDQLFSP